MIYCKLTKTITVSENFFQKIINLKKKFNEKQTKKLAVHKTYLK